jgi:squalene-hopene/tetraprenyl-beta-curcumene cyclase
MVAWAMHRVGHPERYGDSMRRAADWICGMRSKNGGFAAFDADNTFFYLNDIPFADHGALLDPPTSDVSGSCFRFLTALARPGDESTRASCLEFLRREQEPEGCWFGRWGSNYIYGTWAVLLGLGEAGLDAGEPMVRKAVDWLMACQHPDGGWGESNDSYHDRLLAGGGGPSTSFQTAWALLGLMAVGEGRNPAVARGIAYLLRRQSADGLWSDPWFTAPGFPRVFNPKYHGYDKLFPLWAQARYRKLLALEPA